MRLLGRLFLVSLLGAGLAWAQAPSSRTFGTGQAGKRPMTLDDLFALRQVSDPQLAPDGSAIIYVVSVADFERGRWDSDLWLVTPAGQGRQLTFNPGRDSMPRWSPDSRAVAFLSVRGTDGSAARPQIYLLPLPGGEARALTKEPMGVQGFAWSADGKSIYYLAADPPAEPQDPQARRRPPVQVEDEGRPRAHLWRLDVATSEKARVTSGEFHVADFAVSPNGSSVVYASAPTAYFNDLPATELFLIPADGSAPPRQLTRNTWAEGDPVWRPDGSGFLFLAGAEEKFTQRLPQEGLFYFDLANGQVRAVLPGFPGPVEQAEWLGKESILLVAARETRQHLYRLELRSGRMEALTSGAAVVSNASCNGSTRQMAFLRTSPEAPAEVWLLESFRESLQDKPSRQAPPEAGQARALTDHNPRIRELNLGRFEVVRWQASDGVEVEGVLYTPTGSTGPWPLVTIIHGGPAAAEMASFAASSGRPAHLLTALGGAVFLPNYRGSTNYGAAFVTRSVGDRNGRDAQDIEEGIDALVARGVADPNRLALMGWSAGGVLTNWLIANNPRYRAASTGAGVADWTFQYFLSDYTFGSDYYLGGTPWGTHALYWERSPLRLAPQVRTPTLIHSGANDERVPIAHTRAWYRALKQFGVTARFLVYPGEPHTLQQPAHQRRKIEEDLAWFRKHLLGER